MKSGFVSLVGRTNVGKSTILNTIIGQKISIVTPKSQTTRDQIIGIYNNNEAQIVFLDTPGIHKPHNELGELLDKRAYSTIRNCDLALFIIDASKEFNDGDSFLLEHLKFDCDMILVFNKIDLTNINLITSLKEKYLSYFPNNEYIEVSAKENFNLDGLIKLVINHLEEGPQYYDVNTITDKDFKFRVQELVREKALLCLKDEVPHGFAVLCDDIDYSKKELEIYCKIVVEKESQKGIVIGKGAKMIKRIGTLARKDIEAMLQKHVNLILNVQVQEDWRNSSSFLARIGYR